MEKLRPQNQFPRTYTVSLSREETAWNPASTKTVINGPAIVTYTEYQDGGIVCNVERQNLYLTIGWKV